MAETFLKQKGSFRDLIAFQKTECLHDITYYFAHKYLKATDRTVDQMIQAARSGRQNIAEGCMAGTTSTQSELFLLNVAKASLQELLLDYEDYLRVRDLNLNSGHRIRIMPSKPAEYAPLIMNRPFIARQSKKEVLKLSVISR